MTTAPAVLRRGEPQGSIRAAAAAAVTHPAPRAYLRRALSLAPRRRRGFVLLAATGALAVLFATVWERTVANALSMERERLRHEVRDLEQRVRLSAESSDRMLLDAGLDYQTLERLGFHSPDPARIIDMDLKTGRAASGESP